MNQVWRRNQAAMELLLATALWGFGFIATIWALKVLNAFELTLLRFVLAAIVGLPFVLRALRHEPWREWFGLSFLPGVLMSGTLVLQTWGMQYTTATKSAFITTLYVVFVPVFEVVVARKKIPWPLWACVAIALGGTGLMVDVGVSRPNFGDFLVFLCALVATVQIYWMGRVSPNVKRPFAFNIGQCLWAIPLTWPFVHTGDLLSKLRMVGQWPGRSLFGVLLLAFGSTLIAFYLQVRAQAKLSPTVSSLMFLLESPFALGFSLYFLSSRLTTLESVGAGLIFLSAFWATRLEEKV